MILGMTHGCDVIVLYYEYENLIPLWKETVADEGGPIRFRCRPKKVWVPMTDPSLRSIGEELCHETQCVALMCCYCMIPWVWDSNFSL